MIGLGKQIDYFEYDFLAGPLSLPELHQDILKGNCRLLLQIYFLQQNGLYLTPEELLNPYAFEEKGEFVKEPRQDYGLTNFFEGLNTGDVIFAERVKNKKKEPVDFSAKALGSEEAWTIRMHTAIFLGDPIEYDGLLSPKIPTVGDNLGKRAVFHATSIQGSTTVWSPKEFTDYYKPIAAKQFN